MSHLHMAAVILVTAHQPILMEEATELITMDILLLRTRRTEVATVIVLCTQISAAAEHMVTALLPTTKQNLERDFGIGGKGKMSYLILMELVSEGTEELAMMPTFPMTTISLILAFGSCPSTLSKACSGPCLSQSSNGYHSVLRSTTTTTARVKREHYIIGIRYVEVAMHSNS